MKSLHYISQAHENVSTAQEKPSMDIEHILRSLNARNLGFVRTLTNNIKLKKYLNFLNSLLALWRMPAEEIVILQYPSQSRIKQLYNRARAKGNKIILLVHDIDELRGCVGDHSGILTHILSDADVVILHTEKMKEWYEEKFHPVNHPVVLGIFDYLLPEIAKENDHHHIIDEKSENSGFKIVFAGNLRKSPFIYSLPEHDSVKFFLHGPGIDKMRLPEHVTYKGVASPDDIISQLRNYDFGLIWDGEIIDGCSGAWGEYLQFNAPYKASSYLTSGIPLIVWDKMGLKDFVEDNKIGICVNSLDDIPERLSQMSSAEYAEMKENAHAISKKMRAGYFSTTAITKAVDMLK
ncbi:MAG: hypothetical protein K2K93_06870 [Muribaculaceae bacterium]|nr:hypothetical protein [Muribaculaceae bacterium]